MLHHLICVLRSLLCLLCGEWIEMRSPVGSKMMMAVMKEMKRSGQVRDGDLDGNMVRNTVMDWVSEIREKEIRSMTPKLHN